MTLLHAISARFLIKEVLEGGSCDHDFGNIKYEWDHFLGDFPPVFLNRDRNARRYKSPQMHPPFRESLVSWVIGEISKNECI